MEVTELRATTTRQDLRDERRRRPSKSFQVSQRDLELLLLIAEQYAITLDQLARLIGRSYRTARALRDRWGSAGWVASRKLAIGLPPFAWLTVRGSRLVQSPFRTWDANPGLAGHIEAVTNVRLLVERELELGAWECERALAQASPSRSAQRPHLPDAVLSSSASIAIEVELTLKSHARLAAIIDELSRRFDEVWYFAPPRIADALSELAPTAPEKNVRVHQYPPLAAEVARSSADEGRRR